MSLIKDKLCELTTQVRCTDRGKIVLFHAGLSKIHHEDARSALNTSECGFGFYCFFNPIAAIDHHYASCPYINVYSLDIDRLIKDVYCVRLLPKYQCNFIENGRYITKMMYISIETDNKIHLLFDRGRSQFVKYYGGQICIKSELAKAYMDDIALLTREEFIEEYELFEGSWYNKLIQ